MCENKTGENLTLCSCDRFGGIFAWRKFPAIRYCTKAMFLLWNWFFRYKLTIEGTNFIKVRFRYNVVRGRNKVCIQGTNSIKLGHITTCTVGREECIIKRQTEVCVPWWKVITKLQYQYTYKRIFCFGAVFLHMKWLFRGQICVKTF